MTVVRIINAEIDRCDMEIASIRQKKSGLMEERVRRIFDEYGIRDGDTVYKGNQPYLFSLEHSTAHHEGSNTWVAVHGRKSESHIRTEQVAFGTEKCLDEILLPKTLRKGS